MIEYETTKIVYCDCCGEEIYKYNESFHLFKFGVYEKQICEDCQEKISKEFKERYEDE